ncbi:MAG: branched-chain amino acid ABC transporter permease [Deltaproteobacteria bacterium]|nr:MAG: branched-chain amino acid ABC transporter permease [Deltaproteobacteria bacterium]
MKRMTKLQGFYAVVILALFLLPLFVHNQYVLHLGIMTFLFITIAIGWNILGGYTGQISFGHASFFGIGAYTTAILWLRMGIPPLLTIPLGGLLAAVFGIIWGYPLLRLRGYFFAIATIGVGEATRVLASFWESLTGGSSGLTLPVPKVFSKVPFYYEMLIIAFLVFLLSVWIYNSKFGLGLFAIKDDIDASETLGINTPFYKIMALAVSGFIVGIGGSFYAQYIFYVEPGDVFSFEKSVNLILINIVGGVGTIFGPVFGALIFLVLQEFVLVLFPNLHLLVYGLLLVLIIIYQPNGLAGLIEFVKRKIRKKKHVGGT